MNRAQVTELVEEGCSRLYAKERRLIHFEASERTICSHLAGYLRSLFPGWDVDDDYNREGADGRSKRDNEGLLVPDIVIHKRGERLGPNLVAIEVKGHWNKEDRAEDERRLRRMRAEYRYEFLFRLELNPESFDLIPVDP